jgi:hypothetical protein
MIAPRGLHFLLDPYTPGNRLAQAEAIVAWAFAIRRFISAHYVPPRTLPRLF